MSDIKFIDLKTGNVFNGDAPYYIHWFEGEQSTDLIYSQPICFISKTQQVNVNIEDNEIFHLIDPNKLGSRISNNSHYELNEIITDGEIVSNGTYYQQHYIHIIYIIGSAKQEGEYIVDLSIGESIYKIGADFYGPNESLYINLSNNGIEIPDSIQKAIYETDIREDKRDNILINRKWKELLSNLWDIYSNKGSYKSLYNSLKWFEYGDLVKLGELWRKHDGDEYSYSINDMQCFLRDLYGKYESGVQKTTYIGLYCALNKIKKDNNGNTVYENNGTSLDSNPMLESISFKWSKEDMAIKMFLLGNFYKAYFMPIHLDLIHSTIEDIVYADPIKLLSGTIVNRFDYVDNTESLKCNIEDGQTFKLGVVECYVGPDTVFGNRNLNGSDEHITENILGVQRDVPSLTFNLDNEENIKNYSFQLYKEVGTIVDFNVFLDIPQNDSILEGMIIIKDESGYIRKGIDNNITTHGGNIFFSILFRNESKYDISLQFRTSLGKVYTKRFSINVTDNEHIGLNLYKIVNNEWYIEKNMNNYISLRYKNDIINTDIITQYIPALLTNDDNYSGIKLNHQVVIKGAGPSVDQNAYDVKSITKNGIVYNVYTCKKFGRDINGEKIFEDYKSQIYKDEYVFIPENHGLVKLTGEMIEDYTIDSSKDTLCIIPDLPYGLKIDGCTWKFKNISNHSIEPITLTGIAEPFIAPMQSKILNPGYYNIEFTYKIGDEEKTIKYNSSFRVI